MVNVELLFSSSSAPYIKTKPIHPSQIETELPEGLKIRIQVIPNYELEQLILSFGEGVRVISPPLLVEKITFRLKNNLNQYRK